MPVFTNGSPQYEEPEDQNQGGWFCYKPFQVHIVEFCVEWFPLCSKIRVSNQTFNIMTVIQNNLMYSYYFASKSNNDKIKLVNVIWDRNF